jgi:hypothetical protein
MNRTLVRALALGGGVLLSGTLLAGPASAADFYVTQTVSATLAQDTLYFRGVEVAFVSLRENANGSRLLEVCNIGGSYTDGLINVADANGNSTDQIFDYEDWAGGGCFEETLGYPIRKFELNWFDNSTQALYDPPNWMLPPT